LGGPTVIGEAEDATVRFVKMLFDQRLSNMFQIIRGFHREVLEVKTLHNLDGVQWMALLQM